MDDPMNMIWWMRNEYLLGTMLIGIPKESLMKVWDGILQRFMHIPTQFDSSKNLQIVL